MTEWKNALEAGINKAWGGRNPTGYSSTIILIALIARTLDEAGFKVVRKSDLIDGLEGDSDAPRSDPEPARPRVLRQLPHPLEHDEPAGRVRLVAQPVVQDVPVLDSPHLRDEPAVRLADDVLGRPSVLVRPVLVDPLLVVRRGRLDVRVGGRLQHGQPDGEALATARHARHVLVDLADGLPEVLGDADDIVVVPGCLGHRVPPPVTATGEVPLG